MPSRATTWCWWTKATAAPGRRGRRWMARRNALCEKGFSFEYSATFRQAVKGNAALHRPATRAASCSTIRTATFTATAYGKDYHILNLDDALRSRPARSLPDRLPAGRSISSSGCSTSKQVRIPAVQHRAAALDLRRRQRQAVRRREPTHRFRCDRDPARSCRASPMTGCIGACDRAMLISGGLPTSRPESFRKPLRLSHRAGSVGRAAIRRHLCAAVQRTRRRRACMSST